MCGRFTLLVKPDDLKDRYNLEEVPLLNRNVQDGDLLETLLLPYDENQMKAYAVSKMVGNVKNDQPECIAEI
ncbi:SOS response-associated peptidase family protein [Brevibacillus laterosporus]|uniref:SOS response-associated peptidase family protein n=1 Tax=Brevibacillus laterosporus TaxID=1465 RepID=UPI003D202001